MRSTQRMARRSNHDPDAATRSHIAFLRRKKTQVCLMPAWIFYSLWIRAGITRICAWPHGLRAEPATGITTYCPCMNSVCRQTGRIYAPLASKFGAFGAAGTSSMENGLIARGLMWGYPLTRVSYQLFPNRWGAINMILWLDICYRIRNVYKMA